MSFPINKSVFSRSSITNLTSLFRRSKSVELTGVECKAIGEGLDKAKVSTFGLFASGNSNKIETITFNSELSVTAPVKTKGVFQTTRNYLLDKINCIDDDLYKIITFNKITRPNSNFLIIDKATSKAVLYRGDKVVSEFDVGVGEMVGDSLNSVPYDYVTKVFGKFGRTTPSGEYKTAILPDSCANKSDYIANGETNAILLSGVMHPASFKQNTSLALHQFPNDMYEQRLKLMDLQIERKGMSTGCVNFKTEDLQNLAEQLPEGTPVYILPEEAGNTLKLVELPNKKLWFQTQYADTERNNMLEAAINKYFGFNIS